MSTNILDKLKKYWGAFLAGSIFLVLGVITLSGIVVWAGHATHTKTVYGLAGLGVLVGLLEIYEAVKLLRIPFKSN